MARLQIIISNVNMRLLFHTKLQNKFLEVSKSLIIIAQASQWFIKRKTNTEELGKGFAFREDNEIMNSFNIQSLVNLYLKNFNNVKKKERIHTNSVDYL